MANSLGTLSGTLVLQEALRLTFRKLIPLGLISLGFKNLQGQVEQMQLGQTAVTRVRQVATVNAFGSAAGNSTTADVPCELTNHQQVYVQFLTTDYESTNRDLIREQAEPMAVSITQHILASATSLWTPTNYAVISKLVVASGWTRANTSLPLKGKLDLAGVPDMGDRFFVFNSPVELAILGDQMVVANLYNINNNSAITDGVLPKVDNFKMAPYYDIPGNTVNLIGAAGTPDATVYAARPPKNPEGLMPGVPYPGAIGYITDPFSGFSVMVNQWIDQTTRALNTRLDWLEGYAVGNPNNLALLTTA
jgi:hypothetical protein